MGPWGVIVITTQWNTRPDNATLNKQNTNEIWQTKYWWRQRRPSGGVYHRQRPLALHGERRRGGKGLGERGKGTGGEGERDWGRGEGGVGARSMGEGDRMVN